jgi:hypothetical protein
MIAVESVRVVNKLDSLGNCEGLLKALETDYKKGIESNEDKLKDRVKAFGTNERRQIKTRGI